ncbi:MAG: hypothetical protein COV45_02055 [Deltaproteobacteria bacterium CG11_big_fil_rev_8_21_14_0_20_47_16]|nr:MAG: hypothetical protein COV45_02055 [Deltaproteobacteria bacterium CG11_big_fil_rev_8_21_14_0_20_47_16]
MSTKLTYWKTLEQKDRTEEAIAAENREFFVLPKENDEADQSQPVERRDFLKLLGMGAAMTAIAACARRPVEKIIPYLNKPEEITFGVPNWYASTCNECPAACGTLVKTREGRPIKMEGNPNHPVSKGGLCARGQASMVNLYDPDRLRGPVTMKRKAGAGESIEWGAVDSIIGTALDQISDGRGNVRVLMSTTTSPATKAAVQQFASAFRGGEVVWFDPISYENVIAAQELSYGTAVLPRYRFNKADYILSFGSDFLGTQISPVEFTKGFAAKRALDGKKPSMSRFTAIESVPSTTGDNADRRIPVKPGDELAVAAAIAHTLIIQQGHGAADAAVRSFLSSYDAKTVAASTGVDAKVIATVASELWANRGRGIVIGGQAAPGNTQALALELVVNLLNSALGNDGAMIDGTARPSNQALGSYAAALNLITEMMNGSVDLLLIRGVNPAYVFAANDLFAKASAKVPLIISFNDRLDETSEFVDYVCPDHHALESWGDAEPQRGVFSIQQPTISPLFNTRAFQESLLMWAQKSKCSAGALETYNNWYDFLRGYWQKTIYPTTGVNAPSFNAFWDSVLRDGVIVANHNDNGSSRSFRSSGFSTLPAASLNNSTDMYLTLYTPMGLYDGRHANNAWLQELPDPVTKITWDNYVSIAPATAKTLGLNKGDIIKVDTGSTQLEAPIHILPGMHPQGLAIAVGYGRTKSGKVGNGVGVNAFALAAINAKAANWTGIATKIQKTGSNMMLACTQGHQTMEGRPIVKEATFEEFAKNPHAGNEEHHHLITMWDKHKYPGHKWGMAINLNTCTGCSACVIACQAENNIPTVGKDQVARDRVMHWMRIDRYYKGDEANPEVVNQPMLCQHCDNAPCETVCPVIATAHSDEGLNQQIYNRCVGTRYCANNCPYKARKFNFLTYDSAANPEAPLHLMLNPEVTVRTRGVMEKCTFCVQRIEEKKSWAKDRGIALPDGELKTACQQSCPADAIVFGDANNPDSKLAKLMKNPRGYNLLAELNTAPAVTYLTKIRNV